MSESKKQTPKKPAEKKAGKKKQNPVIVWVKKNPVLAGVIALGFIVLVLLLKPKDTETQFIYDGLSEYPESPMMQGGGVGDSAYIDSQIKGLEDYMSSMQAENIAQIESLARWTEQSFSEMTKYMDSGLSGLGKEFDSVYNAVEKLQYMPSALPQVGGISSPIYQPVSSYVLRPDLNIPQPETYQARELMSQIGDRWGEIYRTTGLTNTPEQEALHAQNLQLASQIGGTYNPTSGTYTFSGFSSTQPAPYVAPTQPAMPASGVGSNQYIYLTNLVAAGGGDGVWAQKELNAGRY